MKLVCFRQPDRAAWRLGLLRGERVLPARDLADLDTWLALPPSQRTALATESDGPLLHEVELGPVLPRPPLMIDMGLTPDHLRASARTLFRHELPGPVARLAGWIVGRGTARTEPPYRYYKANPLAVVGPDQDTGWPRWSSYVDVEPELAVVMGAGEAGRPASIAGYTIWNDVSARDVQLPEMIGSGPSRSKDFDRSNVLGPCLVTPDDLPEPRDLAVSVRVGEQLRWTGSTSGYAASPQQAVDDLARIFALQPGTVVGLGTVPGCTGLDHDRWPLPGDRVEIEIEGIGRLRCRMGEPDGPLEPSRWAPRPELDRWRS